MKKGTANPVFQFYVIFPALDFCRKTDETRRIAMKKVKKLALILAVAAVLISACTAAYLTALRRADAALAEQLAEELAVRTPPDPYGAPAILYQYAGWDCMLVRFTGFRGCVSDGNEREHSALAVEVEAPLTTGAPPEGSVCTLLGDPLPVRPASAYGSAIVLTQKLDRQLCSWVHVYCPLRDDGSLDAAGWLEDGMTVDVFTALCADWAAFCAQNGRHGDTLRSSVLEAPRCWRTAFLQFALTRGAPYDDWACDTLGKLLSEKEHSVYLQTEYDGVAQTDLALAARHVPSDPASGSSAQAEAYAQAGGDAVETLLRCAPAAVAQVAAQSGVDASRVVQAAAAIQLGDDWYLPFRDVPRWRVTVTGWTCEEDGRVLVCYRVRSREDSGDAAKTGSVLLRLQRNEADPYLPDPLPRFYENHWA